MKSKEVESFREMWAWYKDRPASFAHTFLSKSPVDRKNPERKHKGQIKWLKNSVEPINTLIPGNRFGKSVVSAMKHIHKNVFRVGRDPADWEDNYETISVSISAEQSKIVFNEAKRLLRTPQAKPLVKQIYSSPFPKIVFFNNSVMHCRSGHDDGKYIDGQEYRYISVDEAGHFKNELKKIVNEVLLMRLTGGGDLDLVGTPKGFGDLFWYANRGLRGVEGYYTQRGAIYDNPFLSAKDIKIRDKLLASGDPRLREQVLYGAFVSEQGMAFTADQLEQMFVPGMPTHEPPILGHRYIQGWDLARRTDWTVGVTFDATTTPWRMVDFVRLQKVPWEVIYRTIKERAEMYQVMTPAIDATGPGGDVIEEELTKRGIYTDPVRTTNLAAKLNLINTLQTAMDEGRQVVGERIVLDEAGNPRSIPDLEPPGGNWGLIRMPPIPEFVDEFGVYEIDDKRLQTDTVMAVALAIGQIYDGALLGEPIIGSSMYDGPVAVPDPTEKSPEETYEMAARRLALQLQGLTDR